MGETAASVMMKLAAMKAAKNQKAANKSSVSTDKAEKSKSQTKKARGDDKSTDKASLKKKRKAGEEEEEESAADVMERLRKMKEMKNRQSAAGGGQQKAQDKKSEMIEGLRIIRPEEEDDDLSEDDFDQDDESLDEEDDDEESSGDGEDSDSDSSEFNGFDDEFSSSKPTSKKTQPTKDEKADDESDDEPIVIRFDGTKSERLAKPTPKEKRNFMSQGVPKSDLQLEKQALLNKHKNKKHKQGDDDDNDDELNLKHDLALQRLITESHILSEANKHGGLSTIDGGDLSFDPIGKTRLKTLDARIDSLAIKSSAQHGRQKHDYYSLNPQSLAEKQTERFNKTKMPMQMRKGMIQKQGERKTKYEKDAKEAGIVLPVAPRTGKKANEKKRDRGLKVSSVGRFTNRGLVLSKRDMASVLGRPSGRGRR